MIAYLDLNIFDRLEKIETINSEDKPHYEKLYSLLIDEKILTVYSNAHLNDLFRGYQKNPTYIHGHLKNIQQFSKDVCICQYWGNKDAIIHRRDIFDFFQNKVNDWEFESEKYDDLFEDQPLMKQTLELHKLVPLPPEFKQGYTDPMFGIMFPLSKIHNNMYSLQSDIYNFQSRLKSDYGLYKTFKMHLENSLGKLKNKREFLTAINANFKDLPKHLELVDVLDILTPKNNTDENLAYSKVIDSFVKYDFSGYKSDGHFNNMFDDALHTFYASHFDLFITNDDRCKYKAEKTFKKLKIKTKVIKISEIDTIDVSI